MLKESFKESFKESLKELLKRSVTEDEDGLEMLGTRQFELQEALTAASELETQLKIEQQAVASAHSELAELRSEHASADARIAVAHAVRDRVQARLKSAEGFLQRFRLLGVVGGFVERPLDCLASSTLVCG